MTKYIAEITGLDNIMTYHSPDYLKVLIFAQNKKGAPYDLHVFDVDQLDWDQDMEVMHCFYPRYGALGYRDKPEVCRVGLVTTRSLEVVFESFTNTRRFLEDWSDPSDERDVNKCLRLLNAMEQKILEVFL